MTSIYTTTETAQGPWPQLGRTWRVETSKTTVNTIVIMHWMDAWSKDLRKTTFVLNGNTEID